MSKAVRRELIFAAVMAACGGALHAASRHIGGFADAYAALMNPVLVNTLGRIMGLFSFSWGEMLIYLAFVLVIGFVVGFVFVIVRKRREKGAVGSYLLRAFSTAAWIAALIFLLFVCNEDVYFARTTFVETYQMGAGSYSTEELAEVCRALAEECSEWSGRVERNEEGIMVCSSDIGSRVREGMMSLGETWPYLAGWYPRPKPILASFAMSYSDLAGIYSVYTIEANYNRDMVPYNFPFTMSHELSHLRGVMPEKEANYVAYLNCIRSEDPELHYSGALLGWIYCGNELYKRDLDLWAEADALLDEASVRDLRANSAFWNRYKGPVADTVQNVNDAYLKAEGVKEGTLSYDLVVDLIVWYEHNMGNVM